MDRGAWYTKYIKLLLKLSCRSDAIPMRMPTERSIDLDKLKLER